MVRTETTLNVLKQREINVRGNQANGKQSEGRAGKKDTENGRKETEGSKVKVNLSP
jgi:hypothetical protein